MLSDPKITAFLPTCKPKLSKQFYKNILGLQLVSEDEYALEFVWNGTSLRITIVDNFTPHPFTVLGFKIDNIAEQIKSLSDKSVEFKKYNHFDQDELGIWTSPTNAKIAWFRDPDGNLLSLTEYPHQNI